MAELPFPPTVIVVHPKERKSKCTVHPLRGDERFSFWKFPKIGPEPLNQYVRLGYGGQVISEKDYDRGLLVLDGTWKLAEKMEEPFKDIEIRSLPPWKTAYPRISKMFEDPQGGLATIEAIFAAYHLMGRKTDRLLDHYHWADQFLKLNQLK
jgi:rRNA small subunit aminocarboxypropyltransferase